jgi:hypothetical protein
MTPRFPFQELPVHAQLPDSAWKIKSIHAESIPVEGSGENAAAGVKESRMNLVPRGRS